MDRLCSFPFLILIVTFCLVFSNCVCSSLVHKTCKSTGDYEFCIQTLDSDPRTATTDLLGLCNISLDLTLHNASDTREYISHLLENATDPTIKKWLNLCLENYGGAVDEISEAFMWLASKVYDNVNVDAQIVSGLAVTCEETFSSGEEKKKEENHKSPLTLRNDNLNRLANVAASIAFILDPDLLV